MSKKSFEALLAAKVRRHTSILNDEEVAFLTKMALRTLRNSFGDNPCFDSQSMERIIRWSSLSAKCEEAREKLGLSLRDVSRRLKIPQYRLRAIESGESGAFQPELADGYFLFLGIQGWVARWKRANRQLADSVGFKLARKRADQ
jgi:DNA-binding transcriptional regulator YiaG